MAEITPSRILTELDAILGILNGTSGNLPPIRPVESYNELASGQSNMSRSAASSAAAVTGTGNLRLTYFTATKAFTAASVRMVSGTTAAAATPTLVRVGLYSLAVNGDGTLIGSTPNDTTLLASTVTAYTKGLSVPVALTAGTRYAIGILVVTGATAPNLWGSTSDGLIFAAAPRMSGLLGSQSDLPASFLTGAVSSSGSRAYFELLP